MSYPTDEAGRQRLAHELTARGFKPTQQRECFDREKISRMVRDMLDGSFDWKDAGWDPVVLGPNGEVVGGHHRVVAAHLAGIDLKAVPGPVPQVQWVPRNLRPVYDWLDELPEVT